MTSLSILINWKEDSYNSILVIVDWFIKIVHDKLIKIAFVILGLAKVIIDVVVRYHGLSDLIVTNKSFFSTLKFGLSFCYFLSLR